MDRDRAAHLDRIDPLGDLRAEFDIPDARPIYLNGNSLGRPARATVEAIADAVADWAARLVGGWDDWVALPGLVGDRLGRLVGAGPGQVLVCDSTTVNLYKLAWGALAARPDQRKIVGWAADFPSDRYVLEGLAAATGRTLALLDAPDDDIEGLMARLDDVVDGDTALVSLSHVQYRSGARLDGAAVTALARERGAVMLWDLAHSAGAVPVDLDAWGADLAVGCTYKYLNAGPGAPGWLYVRRGLQDHLRQPIWGWFGRADQFAMGPGYIPAPGVVSQLTGTPGIIGLRAVESAIGVIERAGVDALWRKSQTLTAMLVEGITERLLPLGATIATPLAPGQRGAHVTVAHPRARDWCRAMIEADLLVTDYRAPDCIRLAPAPLYTRHTDCFDAVELMGDAYRSLP